MALNPPKDLAPRYDVKGGNPKSPTPPYSMQEYQTYANPASGGNGVWKALATGLGGLVVGLLAALFGAYQGKGVSQGELHEYVKEYSPYVQEKLVIAAQQSSQDVLIGETKGKVDRLTQRASETDSKLREDERDLEALRNEVKTKMDIVASLLEQQKGKK